MDGGGDPARCAVLSRCIISSSSRGADGCGGERGGEVMRTFFILVDWSGIEAASQSAQKLPGDSETCTVVYVRKSFLCADSGDIAVVGWI